ncbi:uncharacterized protein RHOBADRAFT_19264 [Rhodotorula graminis WP1]|uniref:Peptide hydrolase n=1 Tax=Rhodotorula graminis (strain WP1) TaxID=578459 RepID=A0A0P9GVW0_RHOGW|nr:uncharacterized protein RHOBADRAFT_19264 [Rhodotorula graminis WP1]KPV71569.1 hypothetical protein RHOBADRAFT_19264 [Rhodotorula graminis WP1]
MSPTTTSRPPVRPPSLPLCVAGPPTDLPPRSRSRRRAVVPAHHHAQRLVSRPLLHAHLARPHARLVRRPLPFSLARTLDSGDSATDPSLPLSLARRRSLTNFTAYFTRYYRSEHGVESQKFLQAHLEHLHATLHPSANLTVTPFVHPSWPQRTLILRWTSRSVPADAPIVLLSAHQDSTNALPFLRAPGADDDGSGTTALVAALEALLRGAWHPTTHALEVHFFSAEEGGLLGSGEVARAYRERGTRVRGMYHMDVVGYVAPGTTPSIGLITDGTSRALTDYLARLIPHVSHLPVRPTECGYACSDHGSWDRVGYPAACLSEGAFDDSAPYMHTAADTLDQPSFSLAHVAEFVKVAIGFAVELAGWEVHVGGRGEGVAAR